MISFRAFSLLQSGTNTSLVCKAVIRAPGSALGALSVSGGGSGGRRTFLPSSRRDRPHIRPPDTLSARRDQLSRFLAAGRLLPTNAARWSLCERCPQGDSARLARRSGQAPLGAQEPAFQALSTQETDHGQESSQDREEDRPEGEEGHCPQAGCREGSRQMNYTLTQAIERTKDLSGELKAARAHEADCVADHEAKLRIAEIAAEAHEKATAHCIALEAEREQLADHIAALVRKVGEPLDVPLAIEDGPKPEMLVVEPGGCAPPVYVTAGYNSIFNEPADLHSQLLAKAEANMNGAYDEATR